MSINRRQILAGMVCGAAGAALGNATPVPAYSSFFWSPVRPDRYLRNTYDLVASRPVDKPSIQGRQSLEMEFRFSEKRRFGRLLWDLTPRRIQRIRFHVFNPNSSRFEIRLQTSLLDTERRRWTLKADNQLLPANDWAEVDAELSEDFLVSKGKERFDVVNLTDVSFFQVAFRFEVARYFPEFGEPVLLYLDGLELF